MIKNMEKEGTKPINHNIQCIYLYIVHVILFVYPVYIHVGKPSSGKKTKGRDKGTKTPKAAGNLPQSSPDGLDTTKPHWTLRVVTNTEVSKYLMNMYINISVVIVSINNNNKNQFL